jgi:hypothetical protein
MNQWAEHYGHRWRVYQRNHNWFVWYPPHEESVLEFHDGIEVRPTRK